MAEGTECDAKTVVDVNAEKGGSKVAEDEPRPRAVKEGVARRSRIDCVGGCRFALAAPIVLAHVARFGTDNKQLLKLLTQENVLMGGFFVITGYVQAYVATKMGESGVESNVLAKPELFFWRRVMSYYPLHVLVSTVFAPMFIWADRQFKTKWRTISFRAFLNYTLLQAWFPKEVEIWNQPAWFFSALTFSNLTMPTVVLPQVAMLSKSGLRRLFRSLTAVSLLQKLAYSETARFHSHNMLSAQSQYPLIWNLTRFHPLWALIEMMMGIVAARDVMLDTKEERSNCKPRPLPYLVACYSSLLLRLTPLDFNDAIIRGTIFVPLFTKFLSEMHRDCLTDDPSAVTRFFGSQTMCLLGSLSFPMFMLHGPIGQIFYKKVVAGKLWGAPKPKSFFPMFLLIVMFCSHLLNEGFVKNQAVQRVSGRLAQILTDRTRGMLQD